MSSDVETNLDTLLGRKANVLLAFHFEPRPAAPRQTQCLRRPTPPCAAGGAAAEKVGEAAGRASANIFSAAKELNGVAKHHHVSHADGVVGEITVLRGPGAVDLSRAGSAV